MDGITSITDDDNLSLHLPFGTHTTAVDANIGDDTLLVKHCDVDDNSGGVHLEADRYIPTVLDCIDVISAIDVGIAIGDTTLVKEPTLECIDAVNVNTIATTLEVDERKTTVDFIAAIDVGVGAVDLVEDGCMPTMDSINGYNVGIGAATLEEDGRMPTVNDIIDVHDNDIDCGSDPLECGSDDDDFDANIDGDELTNTTEDIGAIGRCRENDCTPTVDFVDAIDVGIGVVTLEEDDSMPTADGVNGAACFFNSNNCLPVDGINLEHVDTTIDSCDLVVDHSSFAFDDISIADSTTTIGTNGNPTWIELSTMSTALDGLCMEMGLLSDQPSAHTNIMMELFQAFSTVDSPAIPFAIPFLDSHITVPSTETVSPSQLSYSDGMTTSSLEPGYFLMEPKSAKGSMIDSQLDHWCLVPLLRASNVLVALFGVVITVGMERPPPER